MFVYHVSTQVNHITWRKKCGNLKKNGKKVNGLHSFWFIYDYGNLLSFSYRLIFKNLLFRSIACKRALCYRCFETFETFLPFRITNIICCSRLVKSWDIWNIPSYWEKTPFLFGTICRFWEAVPKLSHLCCSLVWLRLLQYLTTAPFHYLWCHHNHVAFIVLAHLLCVSLNMFALPNVFFLHNQEGIICLPDRKRQPTNFRLTWLSLEAKGIKPTSAKNQGC